jgi:adenosine deaminase
VPLEVCPTSNVCTNVYPSIADHPVGRLIEAGAMVTLNTDDPPMFSTTIRDEYRIVTSTFSLDLDTVVDLHRNAIVASFMPHELRRQLLEEIDATAARCR